MVHDADIKIIGSTQASEGEASPQHATAKASQRHPKTMVLKHIVAFGFNGAIWSVWFLFHLVPNGERPGRV